MLDHVCFYCKHIRVVDKSNEEPMFGCAKKLIADWSFGFYQTISNCEGYEYDENWKDELKESEEINI